MDCTSKSTIALIPRSIAGDVEITTSRSQERTEQLLFRIRLSGTYYFNYYSNIELADGTQLIQLYTSEPDFLLQVLHPTPTGGRGLYSTRVHSHSRSIKESGVNL